METSNKNILKRSDAENAGLFGSVKQIKQVCYKAEEVNGKIIPGEIFYDPRDINENYLKTFDERGAKTYAHYFFEAGASSESKFNARGNLFEVNNYVNGELTLKAVTYYDERGNNLKFVEYDGKGIETGKHHFNRYDDKDHLLEYVFLLEDGSLHMKANYTYDDKGREVMRKWEFNEAHKHQNHTALSKYDDEGKLIEYIYSRENGTCTKTIYKYDEKGLKIEEVEYEDDILEFTKKFKYDGEGRMLEDCQYDAEGELEYKNSYQYDNKGNLIEDRFEENGVFHSKETFKYDDYGKRIEKSVYNEDGDLWYEMVYNEVGQEKAKPSSLYHYEIENDKHGNWVKKIIRYNSNPLYIYIREYIYFGEEDKTKPLTWTITKTKKEETPAIKKTAKNLKATAMKSKAKPENTKDETPITTAQAQWLVEVGVPENFSALRYYALKNNEWPSVFNYSAGNIEAMSLLKALQKDFKAEIVHTNRIKLGVHNEILNNYTLSFPNNPGYMMHAVRILSGNGSDYDLPGFISNGSPFTQVFTSPFQMLHPSDASGKRDMEFELKIDKLVQLHLIYKKPDKPTIYMIETDNGTWSLQGHGVADNFEIKDLDVNYGYGFSKFHDDLMERFNSETKGLVLFHGEPGTGKTFYIRHLLRKMASNNKVVIYMPPNMVDFLVDPAFITFLQKELSNWADEGFFCVLLIEDAEPLLAKREEGVRIQGVTNLLNMSDGLLNDMLNVQIICTFNVDLKKLDSALLRPGRLIARKEFKPLSELDANLLASRLGIKHHFTAPATLSEVYAMLKNKSTLVHDVEPDDGASTNIDDLL